MRKTYLRIEDAIDEACPRSGEPIAPDSPMLYDGAVIGFCNPGGRDEFARAVDAREDGLRARRAFSAELHR